MLDISLQNTPRKILDFSAKIFQMCCDEGLTIADMAFLVRELVARTDELRDKMQLKKLNGGF